MRKVLHFSIAATVIGCTIAGCSQDNNTKKDTPNNQETTSDIGKNSNDDASVSEDTNINSEGEQTFNRASYDELTMPVGYDAGDTDYIHQEGASNIINDMKCSTNSDCLNVSGKPVCNEYWGHCVECGSNQDCKQNADRPFCGFYGSCIECLENKHCLDKPETPYCDIVGDKCVECLSNDNCSKDQYCSKGRCILRESDPDAGVPENELEAVDGCPKGLPEYVETSPECPEGSRYVAEGWSTIGRIQPPPKNVCEEEKDWIYCNYPAVDVYISSFCMQINEVTVGEYKECVKAGKCTEPTRLKSFSREHYYDDNRYNDFPMINVKYSQAEQYCNWRGGRLPTVGEWEKAARGPDKYIWPWGNDPIWTEPLSQCEYANQSNGDWGSCNSDTCPVGLYPKGRSGYGINDMMGNVTEFVMDAFNQKKELREALKNTKDPLIINTSRPNLHSVKGAFYQYEGVFMLDVSDDDPIWEDDEWIGYYYDGFRCVTWSEVNLTRIEYRDYKCFNPPPEKIPTPIDISVAPCQKWNTYFEIKWTPFWDDCGRYELAWREKNSSNWSYKDYFKNEQSTPFEIEGSGNGNDNKGTEYIIRLRAKWGNREDIPVCSDDYIETSVTLADDFTNIDCSSKQPVISNISQSDPANTTYECTDTIY